MDSHALRAARKRRGLTQDQIAQALMTVRKRRSVHRSGDDLDSLTQSMISQMERGVRPIPRRQRELGGLAEPSIHDELVDLLALDDADLREVVGRAARGPYD
jgi:transcriptional regulator with XRE-family HTH domain